MGRFRNVDAQARAVAGDGVHREAVCAGAGYHIHQQQGVFGEERLVIFCRHLIERRDFVICEGEHFRIVQRILELCQFLQRVKFIDGKMENAADGHSILVQCAGIKRL